MNVQGIVKRIQKNYSNLKCKHFQNYFTAHTGWGFLSHLLGSQKSGSTTPSGLPIYVDLAYIPNHCSAKNVDQEFFKRVRSAYYVVSGNDTGSAEPSRAVLDALLEGKAQWGSNLQVTFPHPLFSR